MEEPTTSIIVQELIAVGKLLDTVTLTLKESSVLLASNLLQAFGTMGILFPLVIPTVCQITCNQDTWVQVTAAVLASSIYGNGTWGGNSCCLSFSRVPTTVLQAI